jgi:hypothetical protein
MSDRATSLFRTVFHPVRSLLPGLLCNLAGGQRTGLPTGPHHNIPVIALPGTILERTQMGNAAIATEMYSGIYRFGRESVSGLPDTIFTLDPPSPAWRSSLLRMEWLTGFRASGRTIHGLFALRLISAWVSRRPAYTQDDDKIAVLYNLAIDAPALAAEQSPAAVAVAQAAILQAWHPVAQLRPRNRPQALARCIAQLAAHLAAKPHDAQRQRLTEELTQLLADTIAADGSHVSGRTADAIALLADIELLTRGLTRAAEAMPTALADLQARLLGYLALLTRPDGSLAFHGEDSRGFPKVPMRSESGFAPVAGHARLGGKDSVVFVSAGGSISGESFQLEMHHQAAPVFWLQEGSEASGWHRATGQLICASGGSLLEMQSTSSQAQMRKVSLFLAAAGDDFRLENSDGCTSYDLWFPDPARLSTTHAGAGALIALGKLGNWQLMARNCTMTQHGTTLHIAAQSLNAPMNFALKLVERETRKKSAGKVAPGRLL